METAYEAVYIVDTNLPDDQFTGIIDKYQGVVTRGNGTIDDMDRWEPRRLAYPIKGRREGVYVVMNFRSEPPARDELDRIFRISDDVVRHLIVKQDPAADRFPSRTRAAESERRAQEMAARQAAYPPPVAPAPMTELSAAPAEAAAPTPAVPEPDAATDAGLPPVPALAETAEAQDPQATLAPEATLASQDEPPADAAPAADETAETLADPSSDAAPDEEATGTNASAA